MAYFRGHRAARAEARQPPGTYVALSGGGQAFVPAPLPPKLEWTPDLVAAATEATRAGGAMPEQEETAPLTAPQTAAA